MKTLEPFTRMSAPPAPRPANLRGGLIALGCLGLVFLFPLWDWVRYSAASDLYSHTLLIPVIAGVLVWQKRAGLLRADRGPVGIPLLSGLLIVLALAGLTYFHASGAPLQDRLAAGTAGFAFGAAAVAVFLFGRSAARIVFPLGLLLAMAPFPVLIEDGAERILQHASADAAYLLFQLSGESLYRDGMVFHLPGLALRVAPQCSGIHSSLVLLVSSLVVGHVLLVRAVHRVALVLLVIPLGIARNGLRVFVLGHLSVHFDPDILQSALHHRGGPVFFALSLIPFLAVLAFFIRRERSGNRSAGSQGSAAPATERVVHGAPRSRA